MLKPIYIAVGLIVVGLWCLVGDNSPVKAQFNGCSYGLCNPGSSGGTASTCSSIGYRGPGDVAAASLYYGVRAYNAASCGNKVMNVCDPSNVSCADFVSSSINGDLVTQTLNGTNCGTADTCIVKTLYEQSGQTCVSGACDVTQSTAANRATLKHNCTTFNKFCLVGNSSLVGYASAGTLAISQTFTISWVAKRAVADANTQTTFNSGGSIATYFENAAGLRDVFATGAIHASDGNDGNFHATRGVFNNTTSSIRIDFGTATTGTAGANNMTGTIFVMSDSPVTTNGYRANASFTEVQVNTGTSADIYVNESAYYGGF